MTGLSCSMWGPLIVPWPRIKPGPPVSGAQSHWITGEVPIPLSIKRNIMINMSTKGEKKNVNSFPPFLSCNGPVLFLSKTLQVHPQQRHLDIREKWKHHRTQNTWGTVLNPTEMKVVTSTPLHEGCLPLYRPVKRSPITFLVSREKGTEELLNDGRSVTPCVYEEGWDGWHFTAFPKVFSWCAVRNLWNRLLSDHSRVLWLGCLFSSHSSKSRKMWSMTRLWSITRINEKELKVTKAYDLSRLPSWIFNSLGWCFW